jgi:hypothetical protein
VSPMADEKTPSKVPPYLVAALICDVAVMDPSTRKQNLIGIFDQVHVLKFPAQRAMSVYMKVTDAVGYYPLRIDFVRGDSDELMARAEREINAKDRTKSLDLHINFPPLPIPSSGRYEFRIHANQMYLGSAFLDAVERIQQHPG